MKTKKYKMMILAFILAVCMMLILTSCKDKVQSANAASSDTSDQEMERTPYSYLPLAEVEEDESAEDPNEYPEEEPNDEVNEPDEEEPWEDEPAEDPNEYPEEEPNEEVNEPDEKDPWNDEPETPEEQPEEDSNENWL